MAKEQSQLAVFKYRHGERVSLSGARRIVFMACLIIFPLLLTLALTFYPPATPFALLSLLASLLIYFCGTQTLRIGPRYLICGKRIIYYANVTQLKLSEAQGSLSLQTVSGQPLVIERERFPTGARKAHKVAANKAAKFNKVTAKIIEKVRHAAPTALGS